MSSVICEDSSTSRSRANSYEQVAEAHPFLGIQAGGRLVNDDDFGVADKRLRHPQPPLHAS